MFVWIWKSAQVVPASSYDDFLLLPGPPAEASNPLGIPTGTAPNLPSKRVLNDTSLEVHRGDQGGHGDAKHLGGFARPFLVPDLWKHLVRDVGVHSVLDMGCGYGSSTLWFQTHGLRALCVEGSHDAIRQSVLPLSSIVSHDYTQGPWWPQETYDLIWAVDFVEHVSRQYQYNYVQTFRKAALIVVSASTYTDGWHRVELHDKDWWIRRLSSFGFLYEPDLTKQVVEWAVHPTEEPRPQGIAKMLAESLLVFMNPVVASLPDHLHIFPEMGCGSKVGGALMRRYCGTGLQAAWETPLPTSMRPLELTGAMDNEWVNALVARGMPTENSVHGLLPFEPGQEEFVHPLLDRIEKRNFTGMPVVPVVVWPMIGTGPRSAENQHVHQNGITESRYLRLATDEYDFDPYVVWIGDIGAASSWVQWCSDFHDHVVEAKKLRADKGLPISWPIYIVDFTDYQTSPRCRLVENEMDDSYVKYAKRSVARDRLYSNATKWEEFGRKMRIAAHGIAMKHAPLMVRSDIVQELEYLLKERNLTLADKLEAIDRPVDVSHFWPLDGKGVNRKYAEFRHRVSGIVHSMQNESGINVFVGLKGSALRGGRRSAQSAYVAGMLESKIVVVTQRDLWEDHYRLFEALVSGAMVMTDKMHGLPEGYMNGTSIVEFSTPENLRSLILFYLNNTEKRLDIAFRGRDIAMRRHRTWHRIEDVIFGEVMTTCSALDSPCPYSVHAE